MTRKDLIDRAEWSFATRDFLVTFDREEENDDPADHFDDPADVEFAREGGWNWFAAVVRVWLIDPVTGEADLVGADYLGGCSYRNRADFVAAHRDPDPMNRNCEAYRARHGSSAAVGHYFPDMVRLACREAREAVQARKARLSSLKLREVA